MAKIRERLRALRLRGGRDAVHRIHRGARQVPARPGPAERGRVLVQGRRRAMAVAALRPDRAARPLCRRELRPAAEALSQLSRRLGVPQREAGPGPLPPVHAVRRRHGRLGERRGGRGNLHDGRRLPGGARDQARRLCHQGQQPQGARRRDGGDRPRRRGERRAAADGAARDRQARPARPRGRARAARRGPQGRERRFHQGRGARRSADRPRCSTFATAAVSKLQFGDGVAARAPCDRNCELVDDSRRRRLARQTPPIAPYWPRRPRRARRDRASSCAAPATARIASASTPPSCAGSNITPARSSRRS